MNKVFIVFLLIIVYSATSCVPANKIQLEVLSPAEYTFPDEVEQLLVFNGSYFPEVDTLDYNVIKKLSKEERTILDTLINRSVFEGLFSVLDESPAPHLNSAQYHELRTADTTGFLKPLSLETINELCKEFESDAVLSFEYYGMDFDSFQGYSYEEGYSEAVVELVRVMLWRIYIENAGLDKQFIMRDTLYWSAYGSTFDDAYSKLEDAAEIVREAFWFGGYDLGQKISPHWSETNRNYFDIRYGGENVSLMENKLKEVVNEKSNFKAYKAAYNLALINEKNDDIKNALKWINRAIEMRSSAYARYYQDLLEKRQQYQRSLKKQIE